MGCVDDGEDADAIVETLDRGRSEATRVQDKRSSDDSECKRGSWVTAD